MVNFPEISMWGRGPWGGWGANPLPSRFQGLWNQTEGKVVGGMPYSEGIYEDMNAVVAWRHYWASTPALDSLREYVAFEYSPVPRHVDAVMRAVALLEKTWTDQKDVAMTTAAYNLLAGVDAEITPRARSAWRWRLLLLRARADMQVAANGRACGPVLCAAVKEMAAIQYSQNSSRCGPPKVACACGGGGGEGTPVEQQSPPAPAKRVRGGAFA